MSNTREKRSRQWIGGFLLFTTLIVALADSVSAQSAKRYPSDEYYASLAMLREGKSAEAQHGWETALRKARHEGEEYGIDGIPSAIRIGESLCLQGFPDAGLNEIEVGLLASGRSRNWTNYLKPNPMPYRGLAKDIRGIQWHSTARSPQIGEFPEHWPVAVGLGGVIIENRNGKALEAIRLDALSVYAAQARGLWLRQRWLGPIAKDLPTTNDILEAFPVPRADFPEVLQRSHQICRGLAVMAGARYDEAEKLLRENLEVQGGWQHPLTGVGLLALADLTYRKGDPKAAYSLAADASLIFARLNQFEWMVDASEWMASMDALANQRDSLAALEAMTAWLRTRSYLAYSATCADLAEAAVDFDNATLAESSSAQALRPFNKQIAPTLRVQAAARLVQSRLHFKRGQVDDGLKVLETSLAPLRGTAESGPIARHTFQLHRVRTMLAAGSLSPEVASRLLDQLLDGPSEQAWLQDPLDCLGSITADWEEYAAAWLDGERALNDPIRMVQAFDRVQALRQRYRLPLSARDLDLRLLFHGEKAGMASASDERTAIRKRLPSIDQAADEINTAIQKAQAVRSPDPKSWTNEERQLWTRLEEASIKQDGRIFEAALQRIAIPQTYPTRVDAESIKQQSRVLGFFGTSQRLYGYLIADGRVEQQWVVENPEAARRFYLALMKELAVDGSPAQAASVIDNLDWKASAKSLRNALVPEAAWKRAIEAKQLTVVPDDWLWYVPFELLPTTSKSYSPAVSQTAVRYSVLLGRHNQEKPFDKPRSLIVSQPDYFVADRELNQAFVAQLQASSNAGQVVDIKAKLHSSRWAKTQFDQVVIAADTKLQFGVPFAPMAYDVGGTTSLREWLRLPLKSPRSMVLLGNDMLTGRSSDGHGIEVSRLAFCLAAGGNRSLLLSRRPVHGESGQHLASAYLDASQVVPPAVAWQRSVLALWETPLVEVHEPLVAPNRKDREAPLENLTGASPIFWSGMMLIEN